MYTCGERRKDVPSPCMRRLQRCSTCPMHARVRGGTAENADFRCTDRSGRVASGDGVQRRERSEIVRAARTLRRPGSTVHTCNGMSSGARALVHKKTTPHTLSTHTHTCRENYTTARAYIYRYPRARRAAPRASNRGPARRQRRETREDAEARSLPGAVRPRYTAPNANSRVHLADHSASHRLTSSRPSLPMADRTPCTTTLHAR